ncbi:hypothetical protein Btru_055390 [Bulinus truncatus]|nr:hypothetical protein Btru_055390 [Bulinus truncatus]
MLWTRKEIPSYISSTTVSIQHVTSGVLKREKWRLSKREMSVEMRMGELEDYKLHSENDMSLIACVFMFVCPVIIERDRGCLSMRIVQLENQLVEAQELTETLEFEKSDFKRLYEETLHKLSDYMTKFPANNRSNNSHTYLLSENNTLRLQLADLSEENKQLQGIDTHEGR